MEMKPETLTRRAAARRSETIRRQREAVERCAEAVARHERAGNLMAAALYAEILVECQERLDETLAREALCRDIVVVGDHDPEPRVFHGVHCPGRDPDVSEVI